MMIAPPWRTLRADFFMYFVASIKLSHDTLL